MVFFNLIICDLIFCYLTSFLVERLANCAHCPWRKWRGKLRATSSFKNGFKGIFSLKIVRQVFRIYMSRSFCGSLRSLALLQCLLAMF